MQDKKIKIEFTPIEFTDRDKDMAAFMDRMTEMMRSVYGVDRPS